MADHAESKDMQVKGKQEVTGSAEQTRSGPVFVPPVDIFEIDGNIVLKADLPGVRADDLNIDLKENLLTLTGEMKPFEAADECDLMVEYEVGQYYRQFTIPEQIDREKIDAQLKQGVLTLTLPKAEAAKPRKIEIKS